MGEPGRPVVVVLNGGSSSGTTSIVRAVQALTAEPWLEAARPDREPGMAAGQATLVHRGVAYDLEVDTTGTPVRACAAAVVAAFDLGIAGGRRG